MEDTLTLLPWNIMGIALFIGVYFLFRNKSMRAKMIFLYTGCGVSLALFVCHQICHNVFNGEHWLSLLPLHLCYVSLMFTPVALRFKVKVFYDFIFYVSALGAFMALVFPAATYLRGTWSFMSFTFFAFHFMITAVPLWLFLWKIYSPRITLKQSLYLFSVLLVLAGLMHGLNVLLVKVADIPYANYFWTMVEGGSAENFLLGIFASIWRIDFFYLLFAVPILYAYIGIWNLALHFVQKKKGGGEEEQETVNSQSGFRREERKTAD